MPISTDKEIQELSQLPKTTTRSCGDNLYVIWRPSVKKGGLYFTGRIRRKLAGKWTLPDCHIGRYGKGTGELTLKKARTKWMEIQKWCDEENKVHPADYHKQEKLNLQSAKTLKDAIDGFLDEKEQSIKPATFKEYRNKLNNTVLGIIPADTTLKELSGMKVAGQSFNLQSNKSQAEASLTWEADARNYSSKPSTTQSQKDG